jgi:hypothetical protein
VGVAVNQAGKHGFGGKINDGGAGRNAHVFIFADRPNFVSLDEDDLVLEDSSRVRINQAPGFDGGHLGWSGDAKQAETQADENEILHRATSLGKPLRIADR